MITTIVICIFNYILYNSPFITLFRKSDIKLDGVFIDTFYDPQDENEKTKFDENLSRLWEFSITVKPFECKDIKVALTELMEAQVNKDMICYVIYVNIRYYPNPYNCNVYFLF